jgi:ribose/xylose/arabinose/galactoside ABC-type transport system permease subunit
MKGIIDRVIANRMIFLAVLFAVFFVLLSLFVKDFFTLYNLTNMTQYAVELGLLALAETFVILSGGGGIDLSVGSIMSLAAMVIGVLIGRAGLSMALAVPLGLAAGTLMGYFNGILISYTMIPPLIVTLATMYGYSSLALLIAVDPRFGPNPMPVSNFSDAFYFLGQFRLFEIPFQVLCVFIPLVTMLLFFLNRTAFGRRLYGVGSNETAARFSGINVRRVRISVYTLSGFLCALAGWIITSRVASARPDIGSSYLLEAITIAVLGGVSIKGGEGTIGGVILALVIITMLYNGMDISGIQPIWQLGILGVILVGAVLLNQILIARRRI